jgi:hypothetical protein
MSFGMPVLAGFCTLTIYKRSLETKTTIVQPTRALESIRNFSEPNFRCTLTACSSALNKPV